MNRRDGGAMYLRKCEKRKMHSPVPLLNSTNAAFLSRLEGAGK